MFDREGDDDDRVEGKGKEVGNRGEREREIDRNSPEFLTLKWASNLTRNGKSTA